MFRLLWFYNIYKTMECPNVPNLILHLYTTQNKHSLHYFSFTFKKNQPNI